MLPSLRSSLVASLACLLTSCTSLSLGYDYGEYYATWQLDKYFDTTSAQERFVEPAIQTHLQWHRQQELPKYIWTLREAYLAKSDGLSEAEIRQLLQTFEDHRNAVLEKILPDAARFLATLTPEQHQAFQQAAAAENTELEERLALPLEERREQAFENWLENLEEWYGDFSQPQVAALRQWHSERFDDATDPTRRRLERRLATQRQFLSFLQTQPSPAQAESWLRDWIASWGQPRTDRTTTSWNDRTVERLLFVDSIITAEQREQALARLQDYIDQIESLTLS
jgi:hypothetical protein